VVRKKKKEGDGTEKVYETAGMLGQKGGVTGPMAIRDGILM